MYSRLERAECWTQHQTRFTVGSTEAEAEIGWEKIGVWKRNGRSLARLKSQQPNRTARLPKLLTMSQHVKGKKVHEVSHFRIYVITEHFTFRITSTQCPPTSQFSFSTEPVYIEVQIADCFFKIVFIYVIFQHAPIVQNTCANDTHYLLI